MKVAVLGSGNGGCATAFEITAEISMQDGYAAINDEAMAELVSAAANKALGEGSACKMPAPTMGIEDIGYFCQKAPGCYYQLGIANADKGSIFPLHSPYFFVDLDAISCGAALYVQIAEDFLKSED